MIISHLQFLLKNMIETIIFLLLDQPKPKKERKTNIIVKYD